MKELVARVKWEGSDLSSGASEAGLSEVLLHEVVIGKREIKKGEQMFTRRMMELRKSKPSPEDFKRLREECQQDPSANELAEVWYQKSIQLSPSYYVGYAEHPAKDGLVGFGFSSGIGEVPRELSCGLTFSWDWFNVTGPGRAEKLQESGALSFEQSDTGAGHEITRMVFETDVSFRIAKSGVSDPTKPDWRILIRGGSEIYWPSLVDGQLVSNGIIA